MTHVKKEQITFLPGLGGIHVLFLSVYVFLLAICTYVHRCHWGDRVCLTVAEGHAYGTGHVGQHIKVSIIVHMTLRVTVSIVLCYTHLRTAITCCRTLLTYIITYCYIHYDAQQTFVTAIKLL